MRVNHIKGPAGSGKSTMLQAIMKQQGAKNCLLVGGDSTTAGIIQALDRDPKISTILIDDYQPQTRNISLRKIARHPHAPRLVVHIAHAAGAA